MRRLLRSAALLALALPAPAAAASFQAPVDGPLPFRPFPAPLRDAPPAPGGAPAARAAGTSSGDPVARSAATSYYTKDGMRIIVEVSDEYGDVPPATVQGYIDFLGSRLHGAEMGRLLLYIVTPPEISELCSPSALACYIPDRGLMIVPGQETPEGQPPLAYVVTHEYGHHLGANRDNRPWSAVARGTKRWSTYKGICAGTRAGTLKYDQDEGYRSNPGEGFAESFALLHYREAPWTFDPVLAPDETAFALIDQDVREPWRLRPATRMRGSLAAGGTFDLPVATTLDGRLTLELTGPRRAEWDLEVLATDGRRLIRSRRKGAADTIRYELCERAATVRVVARRGSGPFTLRVATPG